jgi:hypothetical protein
LPFGAGATVTALAIDLGWAGFTAATSAGSALVTIAGPGPNLPTTPFYNGQWVLIAGAGGSNLPWLAQVQSIQAGISITMTTTAPATVSSAPIAAMNQPQPASSGVATYVDPYITAGAARILDPTQALARGLRVVSNNAGDTGWAVQVASYDQYGVPMTEVIPVAANATAYGVKAHKYLASATPYKAPAAPVTFNATTIAGGKLTQVPINSGGTGYQAAPFLTVTGGGGTGAIVSAAISGGVVTSITIVDGGWGYTSAPTITAYGGLSTGAATTGTLSVGTSDLFGLNMRSDKWEYANFYWAGAFLTASTGWTAAYQGFTSNSQSADVRGTIQAGSLGPNGSGATGGSSDGTKRLATFMSIPLYNLVAGTPTGVTVNGSPGSYASLYGVSQA